MREKKDQKNPEYGHLSRSDTCKYRKKSEDHESLLIHIFIENPGNAN